MNTLFISCGLANARIRICHPIIDMNYVRVIINFNIIRIGT